jgi:hypothetical protein
LRNLGALIGAGDSILNSIQNGDLGSTVQNVVNATNILTGTNTQIKQTPSVDLSRIGENIMQGRNPLSSIFVPTSSTVQDGIRRSTSGIFGPSNQGRIDL